MGKKENIKTTAQKWEDFRVAIEPEVAAVRAADNWDTLPASPVGRDGFALRGFNANSRKGRLR